MKILFFIGMVMAAIAMAVNIFLVTVEHKTSTQLVVMFVPLVNGIAMMVVAIGHRVFFKD